MNSRFLFFLLALLIAFVAIPTSTIALEKATARVTDVELDDVWRGTSTCELLYYNTCTGWVWTWSGWSAGDQVGQAFTSCCPAQSSTAVDWLHMYVWTGSPSGYGFTGMVQVFDADANMCPTGAALASQAWLPVSGWNDVSLGGVTVPNSTFTIMYELSNSSVPDPIVFPTDHPDAVPPEAAACGMCYPSSRVSRSFYWGSAATAICPGSALYDGICNAELLWSADVSCTTPIHPTTWGTIKNLYR